MKWKRYWPEFLLVTFVFAIEFGPRWYDYTTRASNPLKGVGWTTQRKLAARYIVRVSSYLNHSI